MVGWLLNSHFPCALFSSCDDPNPGGAAVIQKVSSNSEQQVKQRGSEERAEQ